WPEGGRTQALPACFGSTVSWAARMRRPPDPVRSPCRSSLRKSERQSTPMTVRAAWRAPANQSLPAMAHARSAEIAVLPQLCLTLTNAVIVTASLSRELFPSTGSIASERRLALSSGLANVLLCPFGAMPMCHGAGGLAAQFRFGGRTGLTPIIFGAVLLVLAVGFAGHAAALFAIIPIGAVGALLIVAGTD